MKQRHLVANQPAKRVVACLTQKGKMPFGPPVTICKPCCKMLQHHTSQLFQQCYIFFLIFMPVI